jgi:hypothetical protein
MALVTTMATTPMLHLLAPPFALPDHAGGPANVARTYTR